MPKRRWPSAEDVWKQKFLVVLAFIWTIRLDAVQCQGSGATPTVIERFATFDIAPPSRFPYMCSLRHTRDRARHICGAVLVDRLWVLTAAHCVEPARRPGAGPLPFAYCGIHDIDDDDEEHVFFADDVRFHPNWNGATGGGFDIAMVQLNREANLPIPRLTILSGRPLVAEFLSGLGWGKTADGARVKMLQYAPGIRVNSERTCKESWGENYQEESMFCAGIGDNDACEGDSGGPLLQADSPNNDYESGKPEHDLIYGIVSFGNSTCGNSLRPGVYTFVGYFKEWILSVIEGSDSTISSSSVEPSTETSPSSSPSAPVVTLQEAIAAVKDDNAATVRTALEQGLDPDSRYNDTSVLDGDSDATVLHWAARYDSVESAKVLIEFDAGVEATNIFGNTPLHYCGLYNSEVVAEVLLENGAEINSKGHNEWAPLHFAARHGHIPIVTLLLENGANANAATLAGSTALHLLSSDGSVDIARILLENGANINAKNTNEETPLHAAAFDGHLDLVEFLLSNGADVDAVTNRMQTALHQASLGGDNPDVVETLLTNGADINLGDERRTTALHFAARRGHRRVVEVLVRNEADVNAKSGSGETPLHEAAFQGHAGIVQILIDAGADVDVRDNTGETPLHDGAEYGHLAVVEALIDAGASKTIENSDGDTPQDIVCSRAEPNCRRAVRLAIRDLVAV